MISASGYIDAARNMKAKGDLYSHKYCLRMARAEVNNKVVGHGDCYTLRTIGAPSVVVQRNPALPGTWQARLRMRGRGFDVVVMGGCKSIAFGAGYASLGFEVIAVDEACQVTDDAWDRVLGVGLPALSITLQAGMRCADMSGIVYAGKVGREGMSRGDKIRQRKMFGGW